MNKVARTQALEDLIAAKSPLQQTLQAVKRFPWDSERELVELTAAKATSVLELYVDGGLNAKEVTEWAEALEGRDDVALEERNKELLKTLLFELSSPELAEPISVAMAQQWKQRLAGPDQELVR